MSIHYPVASLVEWAQAVLEAAGVPASDTRCVAASLARADARGVRTHGLARLPSYVEKLHTGEVNARPRIEVQHAAGVVTVHADGSLGQVAATAALQAGLCMLREHAVVVCLLRECGHLGALGLFALEAAEAGALAVVAQRTPPLLSLPGLAGPVIGNNPLAFACPVAGGPALVVDMACSVAARGHILLHARNGEPIPPGWALDDTGEPTTDAHAALAGSLLPSGDHKGLALAMLVEMLAGAMAAFESTVQRVASEPRVAIQGAVGRQSACMLLFDARALDAAAPRTAPPTAARYMQAWTRAYLERGGPSARLPGQRGHLLEQRAASEGIAFSDALLSEFRALGKRTQVPFPEGRQRAAPQGMRAHGVS